MAEQIGDFLVDGELGRGGMGIVYRARQIGLDRVVALKVLPPELGHDETFAKRFLDEARRTASLDHAHIAKVFTVGESGTKRFFSMQYLPGGSLEDRLATGLPLPIPIAAQIAADVADALAYAHNHGIVHRDIKPANIMFDEQGLAIVTDFGIAKASDGTRLTSTGMLIGSPPYMSPEQARGNPVDGRADIYALGIVLFRMVTGRLPYDAENPLTLAMMHIQQPIPDPRLVNAAVPGWLATVIIKALQKEPVARFANASELAQALRMQQPVQIDPVTGPVYQPPAPTQQAAYPPPVGTQPAAYPASAPQAPYPQPLPMTPPQTAPTSSGANPMVIVAILIGLVGLMAIGVAVGFWATHGDKGPVNPPVIAKTDTGNPGVLTPGDGEVPLPVQPTGGSDKLPPTLPPATRPDTPPPGYKPLACSRKLYESDLQGKSAMQLDHMRNDIYAYYGSSFNSPDLQAYYKQQSWYTNLGRSHEESEGHMTDIEKANAKFILDYQQAHGLVIQRQPVK